MNEVTVRRIYGSTPAAQKTCWHVHRVLPYLYVPCADIQSQKEGDAFTHEIALAIEKALKLKSKACSKRQHVHGCSLVRAKRFYGYHSSEELFVNKYLSYPHDVSRAANLLLDGGVLNKCLRSHEAHIPFILQFLVDYNFDGMGYIHLSKMKFLHPVPDVFTPKKSVHADQPRKDMNPSTCTPPDSKIQVAVHLLMQLFGYLPRFRLIGGGIFLPILMSQQIQISTPLNVKVFVQSRGM